MVYSQTYLRPCNCIDFGIKKLGLKFLCAYLKNGVNLLKGNFWRKESMTKGALY